MRKLVIAVVGLELLALTACGFTLADDRKLMDGLHWARAFKTEHPQQARAVGLACKNELIVSGNARDGALGLFTCMRREAAARGLA